ncbi:MAG: Na+:solute symporter [Bacteroidia bacterium]|nr:Na+:solute symporter [Bacteroidia bacterium]MCZ2278467.1 Na+:solute symporter [Bacteroidia bacterium]
MLELIDWIIIAGYFVLSLAIGLHFRKRAGKNLTEFFLGGRAMPWYLAGLSMVATTFAADTPLAVNELVAQHGIAGNWLWWNMLLGGMLTTFFFARLWSRSGILTEVELIEFRYGGKPAAWLRGFKAAYLGLFMNSLIIGWVNIALVTILKVFFDIPQSEALWYVAGAMLVTAFYSALSGLWGVTVTDAVQFIIAMTGCIILAFLVLNSEQIGGITGLKERLPASSLDFFPVIGNNESTGTVLALSAASFLAYLSIWAFSWYPGAEPGGGGYVVQRMMSTRSEKESIYATLFFQIANYCLRPWPWILVGLCTLILYPELGEDDKKLGYVMAMKDFLPAGLKGLMLVAFFAAYMSTIATQLNWGASYLVNDLYKRFIKPEAKFRNMEAAHRNYVYAGRLVTFLTMLAGLFATTQITTIAGVWSFIIECGAGLGLVLILRWYWWRINAWSEISATLTPFVAYAVAHFILKMEFPVSFFFTVGTTTTVWLAATFLTRPESEQVLTGFYKKVQPQGFWNPLRKKLNLPEPGSLIPLFICWISAAAMTYSILFTTGYFIFAETAKAFIWLGVASASLIIFGYAVKKAGIF